MLLRLSPKSSPSLFASFGKYVFDSGSLKMHIFLQRWFMALSLLFSLSDTSFSFLKQLKEYDLNKFTAYVQRSIIVT